VILVGGVLTLRGKVVRYERAEWFLVFQRGEWISKIL